MNVFKKTLGAVWRVPFTLLVAAFLVSSVVALVALRHNNETMVRLRDQLYTTDKNGGDVNTALNNLRNYVYAHMNTDLSSGGNTIKPPIQLKYTYQRLIQAQEQAIDSQNSQLYTQAEDYCQAQDPTDYYGYYRVPCVESYLTNHGLNSASVNVPQALYEFDFVSPAWSPDLAGWSLLLSILLLVLLGARFAAYRGGQKVTPLA